MRTFDAHWPADDVWLRARRKWGVWVVTLSDDRSGETRKARFLRWRRARVFIALVEVAIDNDKPVHPLFDNRPMRWVLPAAFLVGIAVWFAIFWTVFS